MPCSYPGCDSPVIRWFKSAGIHIAVFEHPQKRTFWKMPDEIQLCLQIVLHPCLHLCLSLHRAGCHTSGFAFVLTFLLSPWQDVGAVTNAWQPVGMACGFPPLLPTQIPALAENTYCPYGLNPLPKVHLPHHVSNTKNTNCTNSRYEFAVHCNSSALELQQQEKRNPSFVRGRWQRGWVAQSIFVSAAICILMFVSTNCHNR